jgi:hypothetical protein
LFGPGGVDPATEKSGTITRSLGGGARSIGLSLTRHASSQHYWLSNKVILFKMSHGPEEIAAI